jgi:membrane fusion protein, multidrug efflux system
MNRLLFRTLGVVVAVAVGFAAGAVWEARGTPRAAVAATGGGRERAPALVEVVRLEGRTLEDRVVATGTVRARERVDLQTEVSGRVTRVHFSEGSRVERGRILVELDDAELRASLERVRQRRRLAELRVARLAPLRDGGFANQQDFDTAATEAAIQKAEEELVQAQLEKTRIEAPFDGIIGLRNLSEGAVVSPSTRIATLEALQDVTIDFFLAERHAPRVAVGQPVRFTVAGDERQYDARIVAVEPRVDEATRTLLVRAQGANPDLRLRTGSLAQVEWIAARADQTLLVPAPALVITAEGAELFVVEDDKVVRRRVRLGMRRDEEVEVVEGLRAGDSVVIMGIQGLRPGAAVRVRTR